MNPLDMDSDGAVEFMHMPHLMSYDYYRIAHEPTSTGVDSLYEGYHWEEVGPFGADDVDPEIDFTRDAGDIQLLDLNNDRGQQGKSPHQSPHQSPYKSPHKWKPSSMRQGLRRAPMSCSARQV